jgi:hypothetical protein
MIPSFPVAGLMLAAFGDAALVVGISVRTLPVVRISIVRTDKYLSWETLLQIIPVREVSHIVDFVRFTPFDTATPSIQQYPA